MRKLALDDDILLEIEKPAPVSYTHLDVYKRQPYGSGLNNRYSYTYGSTSFPFFVIVSFSAYFV